jgi:hypothetical protein
MQHERHRHLDREGEFCEEVRENARIYLKSFQYGDRDLLAPISMNGLPHSAQRGAKEVPVYNIMPLHTSFGSHSD